MSTKKFSWVLIGSVIFSVLTYALLLIYITWPIESYSISNSGVFGDSFGMLTSLFSGLAFAGLIITIRMQQEELSLQRQELKLLTTELSNQKEEMKIQNKNISLQVFEATFFNSINFLISSRERITFNNKTGSSAIKSVHDTFSSFFYSRGSNLNSEKNTKIGEISFTIENFKELEKIIGEEIKYYYSNILNLFEFIEKSEGVTNKKYYYNLILSNLSRYDYVFLFYSSLDSQRNDEMTILFRKINMFHKMKKEWISIIEHQKFFDQFEFED